MEEVMDDGAAIRSTLVAGGKELRFVGEGDAVARAKCAHDRRLDRIVVVHERAAWQCPAVCITGREEEDATFVRDHGPDVDWCRHARRCRSRGSTPALC